MSLYDINYNNVVDNLLPIQYRSSCIKKWLYSLVYPVQFLRNILFNNWFYSDTYPFCNCIDNLNVLYSGTIVRFVDNSLWMTNYDNIDTNTYNPVIGQITDINGNIIWTKIQNDFIGFDERIHYCNQKIMFEYLLNRYFKHDASSNFIYINTLDTSHNMFEIAELDIDSSVISETDDDSLFFISEGDDENQNNNFTVYVPEQVSLDLGINYENIIRNIADKYNYLGLIYNVVVYY